MSKDSTETELATRTQRCPQCYRPREWPREFIGRRGKPINFCIRCQAKYREWGNKSIADRLASAAKRIDPAPRGRVLFTLRSHNKKTGPIPVSISERGTCPPSCGLYETGCYAHYGKLGSHWRQTSNAAQNWLEWEDFLDEVRRLPPETLWRHNEAGDLPGRGERLDFDRLRELVKANTGRRGFTYTHKINSQNFAAYRWAALAGFTINLSCDSLEEVDRIADLQADKPDPYPLAMGHGDPYPLPMTVLLHEGCPDRIWTIGGRRVVTCPAQTSRTTCSECGLCAVPFRSVIVGFRPHGQAARLAPEAARRRHLELVP